MLDSDGLVEALWDQQPQQASQVGGVVQRHPHLRREALQQRQQHGPGVDLTCKAKKVKRQLYCRFFTRANPGASTEMSEDQLIKNRRLPRDPRV